MGSTNVFLKVVGAGVVPVGDIALDILEEGWGETRHDHEMQDMRDAIENVARASFKDFREETTLLVKELAAAQDAQFQQQMQSFMLQVQSLIRRTQRRPSD
jgi:hypothetical protein